MTQSQPTEALRAIHSLLREATLCRIAADTEARKNIGRHPSQSIWTESEKLDEKLQELKIALHPGMMQTGLHIKWCDDPSFECYVLVAD